MKKVNFKTRNGSFLIFLPEIKETTESGIIKSKEMKEEEQKKADNFITVAVVPEGEQFIKPGTKVLVNLALASIIDIDGEKYGLVPSHGILGFKPDAAQSEKIKSLASNKKIKIK